MKLVDNSSNSSSSQGNVSYFTSLVSQEPQRPFAVLQLNASVLEKDMAMVVSALSFLQRVWLYPVVMLESRMQQQQDRRGQIADNLRLADALEQHGARARPLYTNSFVVDRAQNLIANTASIEQALRHHTLPIVSALAETPSGQIICNLDVMAATVAMSKALRPRKVIFVNDTCGIMDGNGRKMDRIHMDCPEEVACLNRAFRSSSSIRRINDLFNITTAVTITSAAALHNELFSACGAGTQLCSYDAVSESCHDVRAVMS
ncbi:hypothetical protein BX666DRAFT_1963386 [Dichotomocladium elegans]|nr:hypothetical protein BX666DRAFT_1963386 [Dichotomocladium elegans]